jgi:hypothetical protein
MTYGTSHFVSRGAAERYYKDYDYDDTKAAVARKIRDGEIHIGKPRVKAGERLTTVDGGKRYAISTNPARGRKNPTKAQKREKSRKASVQRRVATALSKWLQKANPGTRGAAKVTKVKGGWNIRVVKKSARGKR